MSSKNELVATFIEVAGDAETAIGIVNDALGTNYHRRKLTEWRSRVVKTPRASEEVMRWHVIHAVLDEDVAEQLAPMLDIPPPGGDK